MKKLCALVFMLTVPVLHAAVLEKPVSDGKNKSAFSKERYDELHALRGKIITGYIKNEIFLCHRDIALQMHNTWCQNKVHFEEISRYVELWKDTSYFKKNEPLEEILTTLTSLDERLYNALTKYVKTIDTKKDEKKS